MGVCNSTRCQKLFTTEKTVSVNQPIPVDKLVDELDDMLADKMKDGYKRVS